MEPITECSYRGCGKQYVTGLRLHLIPVENSVLCVKWLINSGLEEFLSQESDVLESMNFAICSDHFQDYNYLNDRTLKEEAVPCQHWDHGCSEELGEIREAKIDQHLQNYSDDCWSSIDLESDSDIETGDEFQTQLGNEIEALLNSLQNLAGQTRQEKKLNFGQSLRDFYTKLNSKGNRYRNKNDTKSMNNLVKFQKATKNMCRTCAEKKSNLVNIADGVADSNISILTKLKLLIEIKDQDVLPKKICQECLTKLDQSYEFFQQIYRADNTLRDILFACNRSSKLNKGKYNGHAVHMRNFKTTNSSPRDKTKEICSDVNDLPFQTIFKDTGVIDNSVCDTAKTNVYESNIINWQMNDSNDNQDKSNLKIEAYSSENTENTVSYLLSDFSHNDAELNWLDVVGVMEKKRKSEISKAKTTLGKSLTCSVQISCKYCEKSFKLRRQLKTHITIKHLRPTNCICEHCNICCRSREHLLKHLIQAHSEPEYRCNDCNDKFSNKEDLRLHIERIHLKTGSIAEIDIIPTSYPNQTFICDDCKETFSSKKTLSNHIHRLHPPFAYACTICKSVLYSEEDTYKHMKLHNHSPLFPCLDCGRMFYSTERLEKHKIIHAKSMPKKRKKVWFHCQLCDASYGIVNELFKHIETHSSEDWEHYRNKILYCGECNARIIGKEKFRIHKMKYHLAKRGDFICLLCDKVIQDFKSLGDYKKHIDSHSDKLKHFAPRRYRCEHCNKAFESNSHCMKHTKSFHSDLTHSYPNCDIKSNGNENLNEHIHKVHNPEEQPVGNQDLEEEQIPPCIREKDFLTVKQTSDQEEVFKNSKNSVQVFKQHLLDTHRDAQKEIDTKMSEKNCGSKYTEDETTSDHKIVLDMHVVETHSGMKKACSGDEIKPELGSVLKEPSLMHHEKELSCKCQYCPKQFDNDECRKNHEVAYHLNNTKSNGV